MRPFIGILDPSARQLHDEHKSGGNQPANISMINRRYQPRTIPKFTLQKNSMCLKTQGALFGLDRRKPYQRLGQISLHDHPFVGQDENAMQKTRDQSHVRRGQQAPGRMVLA